MPAKAEVPPETASVKAHRLRKAWEVRVETCVTCRSELFYASTPGKARYQAWLSASDAFQDLRIIDLTVRRAKWADVCLPVVDSRAERLNDEERHCLLHAYGANAGDPIKAGYREYFYTNRDNPTLVSLCDQGLMAPMSGDVFGAGMTYFLLTKASMPHFLLRRSTEPMVDQIHPDKFAEIARADGAAVDEFAESMKDKLAAARQKGRGGWKDMRPEALSLMLHEHVTKGDPVDVANFCMFLSLRGIPIVSNPATARIAEIEPEIVRLRAIAVHLHWMARRYADGRQSYSTSLHNENTRALLAMGVPLNATGDGTLWARDSAGRAYDGLTDEEAALGSAPNWRHDDKERRIEQQKMLIELLVSALRAIAKGDPSEVREFQIFARSMVESVEREKEV